MLISVVMGVHNGGAYLEESIQSILGQASVELELIVVDDGSTDQTPHLLERLSSEDARLRVLRQDNQGLTGALVRGCSEARGDLIARQDADDRSLAGRLLAQHSAITADPRLAMVSCWTRTIGPRGEVLYESRPEPDADAATRALLARSRGPAHGAVMFRRDAYLAAGGYREAFRYAQDWDLWLRLGRLGSLAFVPEVLYEVRVHGASIGSTRRDQQRLLGSLAARAQEARERGEPEGPVLAEAARVSSLPRGARAPRSCDRFVASCLLRRGDLRGLRYLWRALAGSPAE